MMPIQMILVLVFVFALVRVVGRFVSKDLSFSATVGWLVFWIAAGVVAVWPDSTFIVARTVGVTRGADLVVYAALVVLFFVAFRSMVRQEKLQRDITTLTRALTLSDKDKKV